MIYHEELGEIARGDPSFTIRITLTREYPIAWSGAIGRIDLPMVKALAERLGGMADCFVCGRDGFVEAASVLLMQAGQPAEAIRTERFGGNSPLDCPGRTLSNAVSESHRVGASARMQIRESVHGNDHPDGTVGSGGAEWRNCLALPNACRRDSTSRTNFLCCRLVPRRHGLGCSAARMKRPDRGDLWLHRIAIRECPS